MSLSSLLECPICMDTYHRPKVLAACQHTVCLRCLYKLYVEGVANNRGAANDLVLCPMCKTPCPLGDGVPRHRPLTMGELDALLPNNLTMGDLLDYWHTSNSKGGGEKYTRGLRHYVKELRRELKRYRRNRKSFKIEPSPKYGRKRTGGRRLKNKKDEKREKRSKHQKKRKTDKHHKKSRSKHKDKADKKKRKGGDKSTKSKHRTRGDVIKKKRSEKHKRHKRHKRRSRSDKDKKRDRLVVYRTVVVRENATRCCAIL